MMETAGQDKHNQEQQQVEATEQEVPKTEKLEREISRLQKELDSEKRNSNELSKRMRYLQADVINAQRQSERTLLESRLASRMEFALELISIKEDIERAIASARLSEENKSILDGLAMVAERIENGLVSQDVAPIETKNGMSLDPRYHEAVSFREQEGARDGEIHKVIRDGYTMGGKVIRPALVEVLRSKKQDTGPGEGRKTEENKSREVKAIENGTASTNGATTNETKQEA